MFGADWVLTSKLANGHKHFTLHTSQATGHSPRSTTPVYTPTHTHTSTIPFHNSRPRCPHTTIDSSALTSHLGLVASPLHSSPDPDGSDLFYHTTFILFILFISFISFISFITFTLHSTVHDDTVLGMVDQIFTSYRVRYRRQGFEHPNPAG